jgi:glycosyltransferase involved in cell wall biosynthesis
MHLVDTLAVGGAELLAVNLVNHLPRDRYRPYLCTTRQTGPLLSRLHADVKCLHLGRRNRFDLLALQRLIRFVREQDIQLLHAHGSALFVAKVVTMCVPAAKLIWHAHYGRFAAENRHALIFRAACGKATVITVNKQLAHWARHRLCIPSDRVHYMRNFVIECPEVSPAEDLPGQPGSRVVCVANIRPEKDQLTLIRAFAITVQKFPEAHLILVGNFTDRGYHLLLQEHIARLRLTDRISFLGLRGDIYCVLKACDVGVLSSVIEGLPMALLEYGTAGLPAIATRVGQCPEVLDDGRAGILVDPQSPKELSRALEGMLELPEMRDALGVTFRNHVAYNYGSEGVLNELSGIYDTLLPKARSLPTWERLQEQRHL